MRCVVTGATGAIGMALLSELIERKIPTLVLCRGDSPKSGRIPEHPLIRRESCSLAEMKDFGHAVGEGYDVFFHLAWEGTTGEARNDMVLQNRNVAYTLESHS